MRITQSDLKAGGLILELVSEGIVITTASVVQKAPARGKKLERLKCGRAHWYRPGLLRLNPTAAAIEFGDLGQPPADVIVTQPPGSFLEIRLQMENRAAVFLLAATGHLGQIAYEFLAVTRHQPRHNL